MSKVITQLNQIQADANAYFVAFHDLHWNVKGLQFFSLHEATEEAYDEMSELFDDAAERAIQIGGKAITKQSELVSAAKAPFNHKDSYTAIEVVEALKSAYTYLLAEFKKLHETAEAAGDIVTSNFAQDKFASYEKKIWMLSATLAH